MAEEKTQRRERVQGDFRVSQEKNRTKSDFAYVFHRTSEAFERGSEGVHVPLAVRWNPRCSSHLGER